MSYSTGASTTAFEPIAVIGLGAILPRARGVADYWRNILSKADCLDEVPESRWRLGDFYDPDPSAEDKVYARRGGFLPEIDFDPVEFGLPPQSLEVTDSAQLLSLVVAKDALDDAECGPESEYDHSRTGVVLGVAGTTMKLLQSLSQRLEYPLIEKLLRASGIPDHVIGPVLSAFRAAHVGWNENAFPGLLANVVAGRISNRFGLGGVNFTVDAACASSLGALQVAISALQSRQCDVMLTGGVDTDNSITAFASFAKTQTLSRKGKVRPFDRDADGTLISEGIGMLVLKRLADAFRDRNRIYAVVRGLGSASDGRSKSIYAPLKDGQVRAMQMAYERAGVSPAEMELIEAHAPGTRVGDATEFAALNEVFDEAGAPRGRTALGSVKSQIGHTKAAAGAASLLKAVLALHHQILPPTLNIEEPNPDLGLESSAFYLNTDVRPWMRNRAHPRRAGVNALGFGGVNFHVILEEAPDAKTKRAVVPIRQESISKNGHSGGHSNSAESTDRLAGLGVAVFPGQGSQTPNMGRPVLAESSYFRELLEAMDERLIRRGHEPLSAVLFPAPTFQAGAGSEPALRLRQTLYTQAGIGVTSMACHRLLCERGFRPSLAFGHSFGELTALWATGVFTDDDFLDLIIARGETFTSPEAPGEQSGMLSVEAPAEEVESWLVAFPEIDIANFNAPRQVVVGGLTREIGPFESYLREKGCNFTRLKVAAAFHTRCVEFGRAGWERALDAASFHRPDFPVYANFTARPYPSEPEAMRALLREHPFRPVHFQTEVENIWAAGHRTFVEIGPKRVLTQLIGAILGTRQHQCSATFPEKSGRLLLEDCVESLGLRPASEGREKKAAKAASKAAITLSGAAYVSRETTREAAEKLAALRQLAPAPVSGRPSRVDELWERALESHHEIQMATLSVHGDYLKALAEQTHRGAALAGAAPSPAGERELARLEEFSAKLTTLHEEFLTAQRRDVGAILDLLRPAGAPNSACAAPVVSPPVAVQKILSEARREIESERPAATSPQRSAPLARLASGEVYEIILAIISEKTGYPTEVIEPAMHLEADLGIDSIKRVEILSTIRERLSVEIPVEEEVRTIADIRAACSTPKRESELAPAAEKPGRINLLEVILEIICAKTGYPRDVIEPGMDLEADLGIDSIKRVEIFSSLQQRLKLAKSEWAGLEVRTIADIVRIVGEPPAQGATSQRPAEIKPPPSRAAIPVLESFWQPIGRPTGRRRAWPTGEVLLILGDDESLALAVAAELDAQHIPSAVLLDPSAESQNRQKVEALQDWKSSTLEEALGRIAARLGQIGGIIRLWSRPANFSIEREGLKHALFLARVSRARLWPTSESSPSGLLFALGLDGSFGSGRPSDSILGGITGLAKTLREEWPALPVRCVDLGTSMSAEKAAVVTIEEFFDMTNLPVEVGYGPAGRMTIGWQPVRGEGRALKLTGEDTLLVTGGGRGITAACLLKLVEGRPCRVIILGRTRLGVDAENGEDASGDEARAKARIYEELKRTGKSATPAGIDAEFRQVRARAEIQTTLRRLREGGATATYVESDVGDETNLRDALQPILAEWGPITGVIHGAGVLADKRIEDLTGKDFETVFRPKVDGLRSLLSVCDISRVQFFALFSSSAAVFGNPGQAVYAMANGILNTQAAWLATRSPESRVLALCWGPWDGGMVTANLKELFAKRGVGTIPVDMGTTVFADLILGRRSCAGTKVLFSEPLTPARPPGNEIVHVRQLTLEDHPYVRDHLVDGKPVLPAAWPLAWMAQIAEDAFAGMKFVRAENFRLLHGIIFDQSLAEEHELRLDDVRQDGTGATCHAVVRSRDGGGRWRSHYTANLTLARARRPAPPELAARISGLPGDAVPRTGWPSYRNGLIRYGPGFHGLDGVLELSEQRVVTRFTAPEATLTTSGRYPVAALAPHAYELATHGILIWLEHFHCLGCLPAETGAIHQFEPMPVGQPCYTLLEIDGFQPPFVEFSFLVFDDAGRVFHQGTALRMVVAPLRVPSLAT